VVSSKDYEGTRNLCVLYESEQAMNSFLFGVIYSIVWTRGWHEEHWQQHDNWIANCWKQSCDRHKSGRSQLDDPSQ